MSNKKTIIRKDGSIIIVENFKTDVKIERVGKQGQKGNNGQAATIAVGNVTAGDVASIINTGTNTNAVFDFVLPKGEKGDDGDSSTLENIGTGSGIFKETVGSVAYLKTLNTLSDVIKIVSNIDTIDFDFDEVALNQLIDDKLISINEEIEDINAEIININNSLDQHDIQFDTINNNINSINNSISSIQTTLENYEDNFETIATHLLSIDSSISSLNSAITDLNEKVVPTGGTTGQVLVKKSNIDNDVEWKDIVSGQSSSIFVSTVVSLNSGFATNNNSYYVVNISNSSNQGNIATPAPIGTSLYLGRPKNSYKTLDNPSLASSTTYYTAGVFRNINMGFTAEIDFVIDTNLDNKHKFYVGEVSVFTGFPNINSGPSSLVNCIGIGYDETDTSFHLFLNNATAGPTKIPLSSFTGNLISSDYAARLVQQPILFSYEVNTTGTLMTFKYKHLLSGREATYSAINAVKRPDVTTPLRPAIGLCGGQNLANGETFSLYNMYITKNLR